MLRLNGWLVVTLALAACNDTGGPVGGGGAGAMALYDTSPARADFFALPWPGDRRLVMGADGHKHLDLGGFYDPGSAIGGYIQAFTDEPLDGFSPQAPVFFRFDGEIAAASLPADLAGSIAAAATAFVVDVTKGSPTYGHRTPVQVHYSHDFGNYIASDSLVLLPEPGFPLRQSTTYAAVLTDGILAADGTPARRDPRLDLMLDEAAIGTTNAHVIGATVFTTRDVTAVMKQLRDAVYAQAPQPKIDDGSFMYVDEDKGKTYSHYEGTYASPNFEEGDPPYLKTGGRIHLEGGAPKVVRTETLRFAVTVPQGQMPAAGWPVVLYAHGTGGSYTSFINDRSAATAARVTDDNDKVIAQLAMISIDQVLHGPRDPSGSDPEVTFYNFQNIVAAHDLAKQAGADDFQLLRLVEAINIAAAPMTGAPIKFDPSRIYFKGHSQGGQTGPLFIAYEPKVKAAILSGAGAVLEVALLNKTEPVKIPGLVQAIVGEPVDLFHPLMALLQTYLDGVDPGNYAHLFYREPPAGQAPKSIYQSLGIVDHYTPVPTIIALALATGNQPANPVLLPIADLALTTMKFVDPPIANNVAGGKATGVLREYLVPNNSNGVPAYDGHFVVFDHPDAIRQSNRFLATHAATGTATLTP